MFLSSQVKTKLIGQPKKFLGICFRFLEEGIHLSQGDYIDHVLKQFHMTDVNSVKKPMEHVVVTKNAGPTTDKPFQSLIGALSYLASGT